MKAPTLSLVLLSLFLMIYSGCKNNSSNDKVVAPVVIVDPPQPDPKPEPIPDPPKPEKMDICGNADFDLMATLNAAANKLKGTPYSRANGTDCSGMFHKVLDTFRDKCPNAILPTFEVDRSSRGIAAWYHDNGDFTFIRDPENSGHLIKPGSVMLYGHGVRSGKTYDLQNMSIEDLKKSGTGINHVAIVLSVKEVDGKVVSYDIFHGLNPGKPAAVTTEVFKNPKYPKHTAYSHWDEPWLGVAPVLAPKKES